MTDLSPLDRRCWPWSHTWTRWGETATVTRNGKPQVAQPRYCTKCNAKQWRKVPLL
jgi:hypothetical protein